MIDGTLEEYLPRPRCESCGKGFVRPVDVMNSNVVFRCSRQGHCFFTVLAELPPLRKTVIYLDTSTVSHMARAKARGDASAPYLKLYEALRRANDRNLIACPGSTIVETEAEFWSLGDTIVDMSRHLSDPGLNHELLVKEAQLFRALKQWLAGEAATLDLNPPWRDAFESDVHVWHSTFNVIMNTRTPEEFIESARRMKDRDLPRIADLYKAYADRGLTFEQVVEVQKYAFGLRVIEDGRLALQGKIWFQQGHITNPVVLYLSTFEKVAAMLQDKRACSFEESLTLAADFLMSTHVVMTPFADISGRLQAGLAMLCRGNAPRQPKPGDQYDIEHIATFMPYVDVFIADGGMAALVNQNHLRLGDPYNTKVQPLGENDIPAFIEWLESLAEGSEVASLSKRISDSIWQGGFHQEFAAAMERDMKAGQS